jgi:thymidylate synthase
VIGLEWPVSFRDAVILGSEESNVAVCVLWSEKERIAAGLDKSLFSVIGNLYSGAGINSIIRNILANPRIRFLVLFGNDITKSGDHVANFFDKGVDSEGFISGTKVRIEEEIDKAAIEDLRKNVELVDLRNKPAGGLKSELAKLNEKKLPAFSEPKVFPESKKAVNNLNSEAAGFVVRGKTIAAAWLKILDLVLKFGVEKPSEYPLRQKELLNVMAVIDKKDSALAEFFNFTDKDLRQYLPTILTPFKPAKVSYTYGERLFKREDEIDMSQMENAVAKLKRCHYSRRAVAFTWRIKDDAKSDNPPCLTHIMWSVQNSKLFQTVHFRSHELFESWPMNLFALKELQELLSAELDLEPGPLTCVSHSAHIYENKWQDAMAVLEKHYKVNYDALELDARGNFRVTLENNKIVVVHLDKEGNKTGHRFEGTNPKEIIAQLLHNHLISRLDHAAYIGRELGRAEAALKNNKKYVQDKI